MKKIFTLSDESFQEEFLSIFAVGLLECLKRDLIDTERAEEWLFSPVTAYSMEKKDYSKQFLHAMEGASELDACRGAKYYYKSITDCELEFYEVLRNAIKWPVSTDLRGKMFIDDLA